MSFIGAAIGIGGAVVGGLVQDRSSRRAVDAQTDASREQIAFDRETRDLIRADQEPYRQAGVTALDALMDLTGLSGGGSSPAPTQSQGNYPTNIGDPSNPYRGAAIRYGGGGYGGRLPSNIRDLIDTDPRFVRDDALGWTSRMAGGGVVEGDYYVINETGPEDVYMAGEVLRNARPTYMKSKREGYVKPAGRNFGGNVGVVPGAGIDNVLGQVPPVYNPDGTVVENDGGREGGYQFQADPGYNFRMSEGMRALERGAAARGGLLSGGFARQAIRYGQDYASNEYSNVYNRIANIAGLGQVANSQNANAALVTGASSGNAISNAGLARASGYVASGNAYGNAINQIAQLPWEQIFSSGNTTAGAPGVV